MRRPLHRGIPVLKLLALAVAGALFAAICGPALAQAPQAMPQQQFDDLVNAITKSVLEKIRSEKPPAPALTAGKP